MRQIITRVRSDGTFPEVGMNDRAVTSYKTQRSARRWAKEYAKGRACRIEYISNDHLQGEPFKVEYF